MATAPDTILGKQLEDLLRCSICKETLTEPRTLGCYHSFCKECLAKHVKSQREEAGEDHEHPFNCPLCRTQFQGESVEQLPANFFINNLLEMLSIQERTLQLHCEFCSGQVPTVCRCIDCESYLCKNCLTGHNKWLDGHVVLTLEELTKPENHAKAKAKSRCRKDGHANKPLEFYCNTCQELACMTCVVLDHPKPEHDCQPTGVVTEQHKEQLKRTSAILQMKSNESQSALQKIKHASQNLQTNTKKAKDAILQQEKEILEEFTKKLKRNTAILIVKVEGKHNEMNRKIVKQHDEMKAYIEKVNGSLEFAQNIIEKGSNEEILSLGNAIEVNANSIEKKCPEVMLPVHYGYFKYLQQKSSRDVVDNYVDLNDLGKIVEPPVQIQSLLACSNILDGNIKLAEQLADWVEDKKFGWQLCYRASHDGWKGEDFHRKCDDVGPSVTLVKCGTNVFGGYTDRSWKQSPSPSVPVHDHGIWSGSKLNPDDKYSIIMYFITQNKNRLVEMKNSEQSFLFSLRNKDNLSPFKCPIYDCKHKEAIFCCDDCGAAFGYFGDLRISDEASTNQHSFSNLGHTYQPPPGYQYGTPQTKALLAGSENFTPTEIEVFRG